MLELTSLHKIWLVIDVWGTFEHKDDETLEKVRSFLSKKLLEFVPLKKQ